MKEKMIYDGTKSCESGCCSNSNCLQIIEKKIGGKIYIIIRDSERPIDEIMTTKKSFKNFIEALPRLKF